MGAKRIAGITVEIGGDTTKLTAALKDVDKSLSTTQSSLRDVNKLLKMDMEIIFLSLINGRFRDMIFSSIQIIREEQLMQDGFPKSDWKLFREKLPDWQENYTDKLNQEYIQLLSGDDCPSEKFWKLDKRIKEDKRSPGVQLRISRSDLFFSLLALLNDGVIGLDDLADFSDDLKETVRMFYERQFSDGSEEE